MIISHTPHTITLIFTRPRCLLNLFSRWFNIQAQTSLFIPRRHSLVKLGIIRVRSWRLFRLFNNFIKQSILFDFTQTVSRKSLFYFVLLRIIRCYTRLRNRTCSTNVACQFHFILIRLIYLFMIWSKCFCSSTQNQLWRTKRSIYVIVGTSWNFFIYLIKPKRSPIGYFFYWFDNRSMVSVFLFERTEIMVWLRKTTAWWRSPKTICFVVHGILD